MKILAAASALLLLATAAHAETYDKQRPFATTMAREDILNAGSLKFFAQLCDPTYQLTLSGKRLIQIARKQKPRLFDAQYAAEAKGPWQITDCPMIVKNINIDTLSKVLEPADQSHPE